MTCEGMRRTLSRQGLFEVLVAHSGVEALELIRRENISAMLLDIEMPDMNGIELMHALEREGLRPLTIIVSGYEKFNYARQALNYGAADYLLKPIDSLDVMELSKRLYGLLEERRGREAHVEHLRAFVREHLDLIRQKLLYDILNNQIAPVSMEEIRATYGIDLNGDRFMAVIVLIRRAEACPGEVEFQVALKLVEDILNELVSRESGVNLFNMENARYVLLVSSDGPIDRRRIDALTGELMQRVRDVPGIECYVGVGDEAQGRSGIASSYNNANNALDYRSLFGAGFVYDIGDYRKEEGVLALGRFCQEVETSLRAMRYDEAQKLLCEFFDYLEADAQAVSPDQASFYATKCIMLLVGVLMDNAVNAMDAFVREMGFLKPGTVTAQLPNLRAFALKLMETVQCEIASCYVERHRHIAEMILRAIEQGYADNRLSVNRLSAQLNYSANYLGAVFKREFGLSINDYINQYRIGRAKVMMDETNLKIYEIAFRVGFNDQHYFSKTFKKFADCSPSEYRERHPKRH
jgi:two-component system response regulator YesN